MKSLFGWFKPKPVVITLESIQDQLGHISNYNLHEYFDHIPFVHSTINNHLQLLDEPYHNVRGIAYDMTGVVNASKGKVFLYDPEHGWSNRSIAIITPGSNPLLYTHYGNKEGGEEYREWYERRIARIAWFQENVSNSFEVADAIQSNTRAYDALTREFEIPSGTCVLKIPYNLLNILGGKPLTNAGKLCWEISGLSISTQSKPRSYCECVVRGNPSTIQWLIDVESRYSKINKER